MVLGDAASKLETVRIFNYVLKSVTWSVFDIIHTRLRGFMVKF